MSAGLVISTLVEVAVVLLIIVGLLHEKKLIVFEDKFLAWVRSRGKKVDAVGEAVYHSRTVVRESERSAKKMPVRRTAGRSARTGRGGRAA